MTHTSLASWLSYIESQHPSEIELGLNRGNTVLARLNLSRPKGKVITVAGTNGKGSTCAMLTQYLCSQNYSVGTYTSPHFLAFNERIALNDAPCNDDIICRAFEAVEAAREGVSLTYFEFSTLAALWVFEQSNLDYWVLEVGLGGRLDSVNMIDTDVAVVTSISLDHIDWLGDDLDIIAREKTGIARKDKLLISGVVNPPPTIASTALEIGANLRQKGCDFRFELGENSWSWTGNGVCYENLPVPSLPLQNAATVIATLVYMELSPTHADLAALFSHVQLMGRFQKVAASPDVYIDVAHNPEAAIELANRIASLPRKPVAVCGMLKDKDIASVMTHLANRFSGWFCSDLAGSRGAKAEELIKHIEHSSPNLASNAMAFHSVGDALSAAMVKAEAEQRSVIVFGSFVTVSDYLALNQSKE
ncbi:bifunctional tetrahydrofolate synthase/dihydrofolate synthase [Marinomonas rhizomae]|uniref:Dihydrofolate synthase/folylpolyglutamate synthase n=1 Tax=Marinomonas rhizomae TaxID=491948 RepID=A0A366JEV9_9GAMM|nr:bifunctional tetrahydrofolate synthase/dihydrofolate synthase [Marinomonas rhizomae]RBP84825.1 dihydrofolate synthase/folylpolyglutamate synthase [Marinomonas rhizomae]RNF74981.1 bifunctional tetrahydrofolate synthase/dihydrofolate synthase [Marinomonas rhizomae]